MGITFPLKCDLAYLRAQRTHLFEFTPLGIKAKILPNMEFDIVFIVTKIRNVLLYVNFT